MCFVSLKAHRRSAVAMVVFAKPADPKVSKTRLAANLRSRYHMTEEESQGLSARLSSAFLKDTAVLLSHFSYDRFLVYSEAPNHPSFHPYREHYFHFLQQGQGDMGERLQIMVTELFDRGYEGILVIGSDTPHLPQTFLEKAINLLLSNKKPSVNKKLILGPAVDGGYYFIATTSPSLQLYEDILWSTSSVLEQTVQRANDLNLDTYYLPRLRDIDHLNDLEYVLSDNSSKCPETRKVFDSISFFTQPSN